MKIKLTANGVGSEPVQLELEECCEVNEVGRLLHAFKQVVDSWDREHSRTSMPTNNRPPQMTQRPPRRSDGDFVPASEEALNALWGAAHTAHTDVESVCREYGVDPNRISKSDAWRMTRDLNEKTGYSRD